MSAPRKGSMAFFGLQRPNKTVKSAAAASSMTKPQSKKQLHHSKQRLCGSKASSLGSRNQEQMSYTKLSSRDFSAFSSSTSRSARNESFQFDEDDLPSTSFSSRRGGFTGTDLSSSSREYVGGFAAAAYEAARYDFMMKKSGQR